MSVVHPRKMQPRPPLQRQEKAVVTLIGALLVFMPWAFGTMHAWAQLTALSLAVTAFGLALMRRSIHDPHRGRLELIMWPRLLKFPLFWLGLALFGLLAIQVMNPSWEWVSDGRRWWLRRVETVEWLPTSTRTPFGFYNLWRTFIVYVTAWLALLAIWVGVTRKTSLLVLARIILINAALIAVVGIVHRITGSREILWMRTFKEAIGLGPFVYHNHGASYLCLVAFMGVAYALWAKVDAARRMAKSSATAVWLALVALLMLAVAYSGSRSGLAFWCLVMIPVVLLWIGVSRRIALRSEPRWVALVLAIFFLAVVGFTASRLDFAELKMKVDHFRSVGLEDRSYTERAEVRNRAALMFKDHWLLGTGAGSFRFLFPIYTRDSKILYDGGRVMWEHAHIDWLQIPIELGLPGIVLILGAFGWCVVRWIKGGGWRYALPAVIVVGCFHTLLHALIDFPFQNPAILITWWAVLIMALRWLEFESAEPAGGPPAR